MWHWMYGFGWGYGMSGMALFWLAVIMALIWFVRAASDRPPARQPPAPPSESPLEILQRRYARGEIDRAEYEEKRRNLS